MKNPLSDVNCICEDQRKSRIRNFWDKQIYKIKSSSFTCPFCKEVFTGLSALGSHLKVHCT